MRSTKIIMLAMAAALLISIPCYAAGSEPEDAPDEVKEICEKYGTEYNICPELLEAICWNESRYTADIAAGSCKGIMQVNEPFHKDRLKKLGVTDIYDMDGNIHTGADYLAELFASYEDPAAVLGLYHGERNAVKKAASGNASSYVKRILKKSEELERLHGK